LSRFLEGGNVLNQAIGEVLEWAAGGAFKDDNAGRMMEADTPKPKAAAERVALALVGA
jgi:hypothetical protein